MRLVETDQLPRYIYKFWTGSLIRDYRQKCMLLWQAEGFESVTLRSHAQASLRREEPLGYTASQMYQKKRIRQD